MARQLSALAAITGLMMVPALALAQAPPRTSWGHADLQGIWDFRTITPLQRPEDAPEFLTEEEAATLEQDAIDQNNRLWEAEARRTEVGADVGGYNNFWMDTGTKPIETRRTSLVVDPTNGRLPELSPSGQERADARREYLGEHAADSYTDRNTSDRCIVGFNAGPPITPLAYNQNMQLFQTRDHVVIYTKWCTRRVSCRSTLTPSLMKASGCGRAILVAPGRATPWSSRPPTSMSSDDGSRSAE
jgi:hypothetical protein